MLAITEQPMMIEAEDGYRLSGLLIAPETPRIGVLMSAATGVPKEFYRRFAMEGAQRGAAVLMYDYRGIGGSAPDEMRGFEAVVVDWGRKDMPAAIRALDAVVAGLPMRGVGHSVGGHIPGFAPNHDRFDRHVFVCVGSGSWRKHHWKVRIPELMFWWLYGPACLALFGYIPAGGLWGGTALPRGVYLQWRMWCQQSDYFFQDLEEELAPNHFAEVAAPITSIIFSDDPISNPVTARDVLAGYANAPSELIVRAPGEYGLSRIDHRGAFRKGAEAVRADIWDAVFADS